MPPTNKRPGSATLDTWLVKRPRSSASVTPTASAEDADSSEQPPPPLLLPLDAGPALSAVAATPVADSPSPPQRLAGCVFAIVGVEDAAEQADLANELEILGATVRASLNPDECTHLLVDKLPSLAEPSELSQAVTSALGVARAHGLAVLSSAALPELLGSQPQTLASDALPPPVMPTADNADTEVEDNAQEDEPSPSLLAPQPVGPPVACPAIDATSSASGAEPREQAQAPAAASLPPLPAEVKLPAFYVDAWDREHVRLPCSPRCLSKQGEPLWHVLCAKLSPPPASMLKLLTALRAIRRALGGHWRFEALQEFIETDLSEGERVHFFGTTLPHMCRQALALPALCPHPLPLLLKGRAGRVALSAEQCASLLCHCFFCSMPFRADGGWRTSRGGSGRGSIGGGAPDLPYFFCGHLFGPLEPPRKGGSWMNATQPHKLRCLLGYFGRLADRAVAATAASGLPWQPPPPPEPPAAANNQPLAGLVFGLAGFEGDEHDDLANELRLLGARTMARTGWSECTHLLVCEEECDVPPTHRDRLRDVSSTEDTHDGAASFFERGAERRAALEAAAARPDEGVVAVTWADVHQIVAAREATAAAALKPPTSPPRVAAAAECATEVTPAAPAATAATAAPIAFERLVLDTSETDLDDYWKAAQDVPLCALHASAEGTIEDAGPHVLHLDFANRVLGGGVLRHGCVQEEIRFLLCPELIVSRLLAESLEDHEALLLYGAERFSSYTGYARTFEYAGPYTEPSAARPTVVAIDATKYERHDVMRQFAPDAIERELNKALVGFARPHSEEAAAQAACDSRAAMAAAARDADSDTHAADDDDSDGHLLSTRLPPICTGNWGCGAFGGDLQLKALIQWLAASLAMRPCVLYRTFGDEALATALGTLTARLRSLNCSVGALAKMLAAFQPHKWPHHAARDVAGHYADVFAFLHARCRRVEDARRPSPPPHDATEAVVETTAAAGDGGGSASEDGDRSGGGGGCAKETGAVIANAEGTTPATPLTWPYWPRGGSGHAASQVARTDAEAVAAGEASCPLEATSGAAVEEYEREGVWNRKDIEVVQACPAVSLSAVGTPPAPAASLHD